MFLIIHQHRYLNNMSKPFNKILKRQKKENLVDSNEDIREPSTQKNKSSDGHKRPLLPSQKKKIQIINPDALKNNEDNNSEPQPKISLGSKPNFKGKREGNKLLIPNPNRQSGHNDPIQQSYGEVPKPTPQVIKKRGQFDFRRRDRENIVMQEEEQQNNFQPQASRDLDVEDSTNLLKKPDLKIKRLTPRREYTNRQQINEESREFSGSGQNGSYHGPETSFPSDIQYREINVEHREEISEGRVDRQKKRTKELGHLLNLEMDLYEQTLSVGNITPYEIYINKIKGGLLKNSVDQSFDQKATNSCQTLPLEYTDFTNQCPQDYSMDANHIENINSEHQFDHFILRIAPVVEELIQPTNTITDPPIFLLAFRPSFKSFLKCPYPIFIYHSQQFSLDLIVIGQKLFIADGQIESVLMIGKVIIAGLKNGHLILWNGQNNKTSRLYHQIKEYTNSTNFQLPSYSNHQLEKYSPYASQFSMVGLLQEGAGEFASVDSCGKIVRWVIEEQQNGGQVLRPISVTELRPLVQRSALKAHSIKKRGESYYINTSVGILILQNSQLRQKLSTHEPILQYELPKRSPLLLAITDSHLLIYNELYSHPLMTIHFQLAGQHLTQIIIPELEHDNREIIILSALYVIDSAAHIYEVRLLENQFQHFKKLSEDEHDGRRDKNIIFRGVNRAGETLETLKLMRDLKVGKSFLKMQISTEKTVANLKLIIEQNRQLMTLLEQQNAMMV